MVMHCDDKIRDADNVIKLYPLVDYVYSKQMSWKLQIINDFNILYIRMCFIVSIDLKRLKPVLVKCK